MSTPHQGTDNPMGERGPLFATTRWSQVVRARDGGSPEAVRALESLCRLYWYPLFAYVRRSGRPVADAEDLTQAFFARLLEKDWLAAADRERGRFRSFLLASLKHFLANEWDRANALKRGGRHQIISLDAQTAEFRLQHEPVEPDAPDSAFDRRWALALLDVVLDRLRIEYAEGGKSALFAHLKATLQEGAPGASLAEMARQLGMSAGALRVAAHRLRRRYREVLRDEIAQTVASPQEVEDELRHLVRALSG